jgi:hypothetical protein
VQACDRLWSDFDVQSEAMQLLMHKRRHMVEHEKAQEIVGRCAGPLTPHSTSCSHWASIDMDAHQVAQRHVHTTVARFMSPSQQSLLCQECLFGVRAKRLHTGSSKCAALL